MFEFKSFLKAIKDGHSQQILLDTCASATLPFLHRGEIEIIGSGKGIFTNRNPALKGNTSVNKQLMQITCSLKEHQTYWTDTCRTKGEGGWVGVNVVSVCVCE